MQYADTVEQSPIRAATLFGSGERFARIKPSRMFSVHVQHPRLKIPITLRISENNGDFVAEHQSIPTHGFGDTVAKAAFDFIDMMEGLFEQLTNDEDILADHLKQDLEVLRDYFNS